MMAVDPGVRGVEWPLRAERERTVSVTRGRSARILCKNIGLKLGNTGHIINPDIFYSFSFW